MGRTWKEQVPPKYLQQREELHLDRWMLEMDRAWESNDGILVYSRLLNTGKFCVEHVVITSRSSDVCSSDLWIPQESAKLPFGMDRRKLRAVDRGYKRDPVGFLVELAEIFGISLEGGD